MSTAHSPDLRAELRKEETTTILFFVNKKKNHESYAHQPSRSDTVLTSRSCSLTYHMGDVDGKRVALAPSTNYERQLLEEAFDRCVGFIFFGTHFTSSIVSFLCAVW